LHQQKAYEHLRYKAGDFLVTERIAKDILSLPMYPQLAHTQQDAVVNKTKEFLKGRVATTR